MINLDSYMKTGRKTDLFGWIRKLFPGKPKAVVEIAEEKKLVEKPCKECGKPIFYDPSWDHIPNFCRECRQKYRNEHDIVRIIHRKCRKCGKQFSFPDNIRHYPNYCRECRTKFRTENAK